MRGDPGSEVLVRLSRVAIGYGRHPFLEGIDMEVRKGDFLALVGPNGAGKTTLLHTMLGLTAPLAGKAWSAAGVRVGYVPQRGQRDPIFPLSTLDVVRGGGRGGRPEGIVSRSLLSRPDKALAALDLVGLANLAEVPFREISGGQQQRVFMARALVREPDILALDEPTAGMDLPAERDLMDLVKRLAEGRGMAVLLVTHQLWLAARHAHRIALLNKDQGSITIDDVSVLMSPERLSALFGRAISIVVEAEGPRVVLAGPAREGRP